MHFAERNSEALETIEEAHAHIESYGERWPAAELHRLRAVLLAATGGNDAEIEAAFHAAISTAKQQKSLSLEKRAKPATQNTADKKQAAQVSTNFDYRLANIQHCEEGMLSESLVGTSALRFKCNSSMSAM